MTTLPAPAPHTMVRRAIAMDHPPLMFPDVVWTREEKFLYVADLLESLPPHSFSMNHWFIFGDLHDIQLDEVDHYTDVVRRANLPTLMHRCGTTACIAGWIATDQVHPAFTLRYEGSAEDFAGKWLGLDSEQANNLFTNIHWWKGVLDKPLESLTEVHQADAVQVLRDIACGNLDL